MNFTNAKHLNITGKSVVRLELGGEVVWKGLPEGYTALDYIETTGTQYINTGFIPNQDSRIVCEFLFKGGQGIYGARTTTTANNFSLRTNSSRWQPGYSGVLGSFTTVPVDNEWHIAEQDKNKFYLDGVLYRTFTYEEFAPPTPIGIGAIIAYTVATETPNPYEGSGCFRTCQIYDNGVLVRDFIPCKTSEGEVGMYDLLNAKFYGNAGTGEFLVG